MKSRTFARLGAAIALVAALGVTACDDDTPPQVQPPVLTVSPQNLQVDVGGTGTIVASVTNVTNPSFTFSSSNNNVATVSGAAGIGTVTGVSAGNATIIVTETVSGLSQGVQVSVTGDGGGGLITVEVTPPAATISIGGTVGLFATVSGTSNQQVTWSSQDASVATVNSSTGVVTGQAAGTAVIVATSAADANARGTATITVSPLTVTVTIAPQNPTIIQGETLQFSAAVSGTSNTAVTWMSSNPNVASVSGTGLATGLTAGSTIITATSVAQPSAVASTNLTVTPPPTANVSIANLGGANPGALAGNVNVTLNVDAPVGSGVQAVQLILSCPTSGDVVVGRQNVSAGTSGQITFTVNTAQLDSAGNAVFRNENCEFRAHLLGANDAIIATASNVQVTLANQNALNATIVADTQAIDQTGLQWNGGDVTVTVTPVIFTAGTTITRVTINVAGATKVDSTAADGFSATFSADSTTAQNGIGDVEASVVVSATSVTSAGTTGPSATFTSAANPFRLDNVEPSTTIASFMADEAALAARMVGTTAFWLNAPFSFSTFIRNATIVDGGVNRNSTTVFVSDSTTTGTRIPGDAFTATTAADVPESTTATEFTAWLVVSDALGNADTLRLQSGDPAVPASTGNATFGVDKQAPVISFHPNSVSANDEQAAASGNFQVEFQDLGASGFATAEPVQVTVVGRDTVSTNSACLVGTVPSGSNTNPANCKPVNDDSQTPVQATDQYQVYTGFVVDRAQNMSNVVTRTVLVDGVAPTNVNISGDNSPEGGTSESYTLEARDNLDLETLRTTVRYPTVTAFGAAPRNEIRGSTATVGSFGFDVFTVRDSTTNTFNPFIVSIEQTAAGVPGGAALLADAVVGYARDLPANQTTATLALTIAAQTSFTAAPDNVNTFSITSSAGASTIRAVVNVTEVGNTANTPFASARLYEVTSTGLVELAVNSNPLIADLGATRDFAYEFSASGAGLSKDDVFVVLGVSSNGRALATQTQTRP